MNVWEKPIRIPARVLTEPAIHSPIFGTVKSGQVHLSQLIKNGNPLDPALVELPEQPGLLHHPVAIPEPEASVYYDRALRNRRLQLTICGVYIPLAMLLGILIDAIFQSMVTLTVLIVTLASYLYLDYRATFLNRNNLIERSTYYAWLFTTARPYLIVTGCFFCASGIIQFVIGSGKFLEHFGLLFSHAEQQPWRILSGSLIHSRLAHWMTNFSFALVVAAVSGPSLRGYFAPLFLLGGCLSFALTLLWVNLFGTYNVDGLVGTSGGLAALLSCQLVLTIRYRESYPKGYFFTLIFFFVVSLVVGAFFYNPVGLVCHLAGGLAGMVLALIVPDYLRDDS